MSCGVGRRCGSDPALLRLWHRPVATAPIRPLAWESPYAMGAALEKGKKTKKKKKKNVLTHNTKPFIFQKDFIRAFKFINLIRRLSLLLC